MCCKPGDVIEVKEKSKQLVPVLEAVGLAERDVPDYIAADHSKMTATFTRRPDSVGSALRGADGTEPGRRVLFALTHRFCLFERPGMPGRFCFMARSVLAFAAQPGFALLVRR